MDSTIDKKGYCKLQIQCVMEDCKAFLEFLERFKQNENTIEVIGTNMECIKYLLMLTKDMVFNYNNNVELLGKILASFGDIFKKSDKKCVWVLPTKNAKLDEE